MMPDLASLQLDPRLTFESYIVGSANRLAAAAARRVADAPGSAYNPLFVYSASGLGKTHLLTAIGEQIRRVNPSMTVVYDTLEHLVESLMEAIQTGERDEFRSRLRTASVLLLDDVQFLAGRRGVQEELLRAWDALAARGGQIVLASDRPPAEIDELDQRLLSRFNGGLIVDLAAPDYETRVAIVRRKAEERGQVLSPGVAEALAKVAFGNVRELQGGLTRVLAVQELDQRAVGVAEVARLLGLDLGGEVTDEFGAFMDDLAGTLSHVIAAVTPEHAVADAIARWRDGGYTTSRLEAALAAGTVDQVADELLDRYRAHVDELAGITAEIRRLDPQAPELAQVDVLRNPDRVQDASLLLSQVRDRTAPLPAPPAQPTFAELALDPGLLAVRAARAVALNPGVRYNPFFVSAAGPGPRELVTALALLFREQQPDAAIAFITGADFTAELIAALEQHRVDSWRARFRRARLVVIDGVDALMNTERAQEELFHLFDDARRSGVQLVFTAGEPPRALAGFEDRLRTRLDSGLVVDLQPHEERLAGETDEAGVGAATDAALREPHAAAAAVGHAAVDEPDEDAAGGLDPVFLDRERLVWHWPYIEECLAARVAT